MLARRVSLNSSSSLTRSMPAFSTSSRSWVCRRIVGDRISRLLERSTFSLKTPRFASVSVLLLMLTVVEIGFGTLGRVLSRSLCWKHCWATGYREKMKTMIDQVEIIRLSAVINIIGNSNT